MQTFFSTAGSICAVFLAVLAIGACSNTQISTELPLSHPANPAAEASAFVLPPNPFATDVTLSDPDRPRPDTAKSDKQQAGGTHQHEMQTMQPEKDSPESDPDMKTEHQH